MFEGEMELVGRARWESEEFDALFLEHQDIEEKLEKLAQINHLNSQEEMEKKRLQKIKLVGKDKMVDILNRFRLEGAR